jgi:hypothetical protein
MPPNGTAEFPPFSAVWLFSENGSRSGNPEGTKANSTLCQKYSMSGQQTPDEGLQDIIEAIEQNVNEARNRIGSGDHSSQELRRAITRILQGRTALISHIRRHMPEALESEWIQELEGSEHTDEEPPEKRY